MAEKKRRIEKRLAMIFFANRCKFVAGRASNIQQESGPCVRADEGWSLIQEYGGMTLHLTEGMTWKQVISIHAPVEMCHFDSGLSGGLGVPEPFDAGTLAADLADGAVAEGFVLCYPAGVVSSNCFISMRMASSSASRTPPARCSSMSFGLH